MKIKINNVANYSHEYLVTDTSIQELENGTIIQKYKLGINKRLTVTTTSEGHKSVEFDTHKKVLKLPPQWYEIIN